FVLLVVAIPIISTHVPEKEPTFEERREIVLTELNLAIEDAKAQGKYRCCIEPACTMCYLGHWIWDDGSCYCDDMIAQGLTDKVCPECKKGIEIGLCNSVKDEECDVDSGEIFKPI
ncbi:MAG: hypothetical protein ABII01_06535, partial [Candidatus Woesearchaeota archaeon]